MKNAEYIKFGKMAFFRNAEMLFISCKKHAYSDI